MHKRLDRCHFSAVPDAENAAHATVPRCRLGIPYLIVFAGFVLHRFTALRLESQALFYRFDLRNTSHNFESYWDYFLSPTLISGLFAIPEAAWILSLISVEQLLWALRFHFICVHCFVLLFCFFFVDFPFSGGCESRPPA